MYASALALRWSLDRKKLNEGCEEEAKEEDQAKKERLGKSGRCTGIPSGQQNCGEGVPESRRTIGPPVGVASWADC